MILLSACMSTCCVSKVLAHSLHSGFVWLCMYSHLVLLVVAAVILTVQPLVLGQQCCHRAKDCAHVDEVPNICTEVRQKPKLSNNGYMGHIPLMSSSSWGQNKDTFINFAWIILTTIMFTFMGSVKVVKNLWFWQSKSMHSSKISLTNMPLCRQEQQKKLPAMFWSKVDLRQLAKHQEQTSSLGQHNGPNVRRTLRKMDSSKRKATSR